MALVDVPALEISTYERNREAHTSERTTAGRSCAAARWRRQPVGRGKLHVFYVASGLCRCRGLCRAYNRDVSRHPLALDTSPEIERMQIEGWRRMSPSEKAATVAALTSAAIEMTRAGIRHRHPDESAESHRMRLAEILLGHDLAHSAFSNSDVS
jgi:hypothetical protein